MITEENIGLKNGEILPSGEVVVYDYDEDNNLVGWHKELIKETE